MNIFTFSGRHQQFLMMEQLNFASKRRLSEKSSSMSYNIRCLLLFFTFCLRKDPVLSCIHKSIEKCHYTYTTQFVPNTEKVCDKVYEKRCSITYTQVSTNISCLKERPTLI